MSTEITEETPAIPRQKHHMDPKYDGPLKHRSCTDVICLLLFAVFIAVWVALGIYAFSSGSPGEIFAPRDSLNRRCGFDEGVEDKPYLVFFDLTTCVVPRKDIFRCNTPQSCEVDPKNLKAAKCKTPQVCVAQCPSENFYFDFYYQQNVAASFLADKLICQPGTPDLTKLDLQGLQRLVKNSSCAAWYLDSASVAHRCLPDLSNFADSVENIIIQLDDGSGGMADTAVNGVSGDALNEASKVVQALSAVSEFWKAVVKDLMETWPWILICICFAMVVSFFYIIIMRWIAGIMVWLSLLASVALLGYCSYISWVKYQELRQMDLTEPEVPQRYTMVRGTPQDPNAPVVRRVPVTGREITTGDVILGAVEDQINSYLRMKNTWLVFFIIAVTVLAVLLLIIIFLRSRIRLAVALINEGSRAVGHSWSTLFFPVFPWLLQVGVICYGVAICLYLFSSGVSIYRINGLANDTACHCTNNYQDGDYCFQDTFISACSDVNNGGACMKATCAFVESESHDFSTVLQLYNLFIFFWTLFFVGALGQMILASTFATYYFTFHKEDIPFFIVASSAWRVIRYHLGTAAFGSLLLAIVSWLRALLEMADSYLKKYDNEFVKAIKCCMRCFFWCLEKFLRFMNKNAYIMCAIEGKNFCSSAMDAFSLLLRNVARVFVLDKVTDFLFFISKLVITAGVGAASFYIFSKPVVNLQDVGTESYQTSYSFVPIVFTVIGAYFIASIFFSVYSMAVDTLFLCFLQDTEQNDGSAEKPYYMSGNLMSILGKKNKVDRV